MNIIDLPTEILAMIFEYLPFSELVTTASLVCKDWRALVEVQRPLKALFINDTNQLTCEHLKSLNPSRQMVVYMKIKRCGFMENAVVDFLTREYTQLQEVVLDRTQSRNRMRYINGRALSGPFVFLSAFTHLNTLKISSGKLKDKDFTGISESCPRLRSLTIENAKKVTEEGFRKIFTQCRELTTLNLIRSRVADSVLFILPKQLENLSIAYVTSTTKRGLQHLVTKKTSNLKHLHLTSDRVKFDLISDIRGLKSLNFSHCRRLTNDCMRRIAVNNQDLQSLDITGCNINDSGLFHLTSENCRHTLQTLVIENCHRLTTDGVHAVLRRCTGLRQVSLTLADPTEVAQDWGLQYPHINFRFSVKSTAPNDPIVENKTQMVETPLDETPMVETPMDETPMIETPMVETPMIETPMIETPMVETPMIETPMVETPMIETPIVETSMVETPMVETPMVETPMVETPMIETPMVETPMDETPMVETPMDETSPDETSQKDTSLVKTRWLIDEFSLRSHV